MTQSRPETAEELRRILSELRRYQARLKRHHEALRDPLADQEALLRERVELQAEHRRLHVGLR